MVRSWSAKEKVETLASWCSVCERDQKKKGARSWLYPPSKKGDRRGLLHQNDAARICLATGNVYEAAGIELVCEGECGFASADECNRIFVELRERCFTRMITNQHPPVLVNSSRPGIGLSAL